MLIANPSRIRIDRALVGRAVPFAYALGFRSIAELVSYLLVQWLAWAEKNPEVLQAQEIDKVIFSPAIWSAAHPAMARYKAQGKGPKKDWLTKLGEEIQAIQGRGPLVSAKPPTESYPGEGPDGPLPEP